MDTTVTFAERVGRALRQVLTILYEQNKGGTMDTNKVLGIDTDKISAALLAGDPPTEFVFRKNCEGVLFPQGLIPISENRYAELIQHLETAMDILRTSNIGAPAQKVPGVPTAKSAEGAYGVEWDYGAGSSRLKRVGLARNFPDPSPAVSLDGTGFSPFDSILPWGGMRVGVFSDGKDEMVYIPEFYYTSYKDVENRKWLWAISPTAKEGFCRHPGSGRYVGRYPSYVTNETAYSKAGVVPTTRTSLTDFRKYSKTEDGEFGLMDLATWSAIQMLYLIEFADFDSQKTLGTGATCGEIVKNGGTAAAEYHTVKAEDASNCYRFIENPFSNVLQWVDGFEGGRNEVEVFGRKLGFGLPADGVITDFGYSEAAPWAFIPCDSDRSEDLDEHAAAWTWTPDDSSSLCPACVGGYYYDYAYSGFFYFYASYSASYSYGNLGSRLQKTA